MSNQKTYYEYLSSILLALVVLTFGLFDTSGHIISTVQVSPAQVELTFEQKNSFNERRICICKAYPQSLVNSSKSHSSSFLFDSNYLISYSTFISVKHQSISKKLNSFNPISHFTQLKRIPQNSDDPVKS